MVAALHLWGINSREGTEVRHMQWHWVWQSEQQMSIAGLQRKVTRRSAALRALWTASHVTRTYWRIVQPTPVHQAIQRPETRLHACTLLSSQQRDPWHLLSSPRLFLWICLSPQTCRGTNIPGNWFCVARIITTSKAWTNNRTRDLQGTRRENRPLGCQNPKVLENKTKWANKTRKQWNKNYNQGLYFSLQFSIQDPFWKSLSHFDPGPSMTCHARSPHYLFLVGAMCWGSFNSIINCLESFTKPVSNGQLYPPSFMAL